MKMGKRKSRSRPGGDLPVVQGNRPKAIALAALHLSEALLLELEASEILTAREIRGVLKDAATTLRNAATQVDNRSCMVASEMVEAIRESFKKSKA
ncbi:hypothetical protein NKI77_23350 [Mesorhizobium opportunistum]|uniref:Uncharacterized protein n=1 Tax=Mesorhizobium opportunistum TaxID=593909 RepID=A0ABV1YK33_9HYPH|nr:hypothetical protein [Mesorhizobium sp.]TIN90219.1 MAG: hypothetical protein E5Y06_33520 [Mesorhizobium sp.]TJU94221.1 MAG: hypothetical protein E5Y08_30710 [Mesorhizobium sp.]TJV13023.1 MAG: hypothetical protein E5Y07_33420 [Mesorhizobium sp.]